MDSRMVYKLPSVILDMKLLTLSSNLIPSPPLIDALEYPPSGPVVLIFIREVSRQFPPVQRRLKRVSPCLVLEKPLTSQGYWLPAACSKPSGGAVFELLGWSAPTASSHPSSLFNFSSTSSRRCSFVAEWSFIAPLRNITQLHTILLNNN